MIRPSRLWQHRWLLSIRSWWSRRRGDSASARAAPTPLGAWEAKHVIGATWHGTDQELLMLQDAIWHNCPSSGMLSADSAHPIHAILLDQDLVDHLLYVYRSRERFVREEFTSGIGA